MAVGLTDNEKARLQRSGFRVIAEAENALIGRKLYRLVAPSRIRGNRAALQRARRVATSARFEANDLYRRPRRDRFRTAGSPCGADCPSFRLTGWSAKISSCVADARIGLIDTRVDTNHPALRAARIVTVDQFRQDRRSSGADHGTAVASLLVGQPNSSVVGLVPRAHLFAANAFHRRGREDRADTFDMLVSLQWLADQDVDVINLSLSGPKNDLIETAVKTLQSKGIAIVAAAGIARRNSGYPARYDGVVGVTAVDSNLRRMRGAARGAHVMFAAPGVGLFAAGDGDRIWQVQGSSFAAPFATAALAAGRRGPGSPPDTLSLLQSGARDLGAPGPDPVFGWGLLRFDALKNCAIAGG